MAKPRVNLDEAKQKFRDFLALKNLKLTAEREKILELVFDVEHHIDVAHLYDEARKRYKDQHLSLATIYRTIPLLEEAGFLKFFHDKGDNKLYELVYGYEHHDHIMCIRCGAIAEFTCEEIEGYQLRVAKKHHYRLIDHRLELFGVCENCQKKSE